MLKRNSNNVLSNTRPKLALQICQKCEPAGRIGDFGNFMKGFVKSPRLMFLPD